MNSAVPVKQQEHVNNLVWYPEPPPLIYILSTSYHQLDISMTGFEISLWLHQSNLICHYLLYFWLTEKNQITIGNSQLQSFQRVGNHNSNITTITNMNQPRLPHYHCHHYQLHHNHTLWIMASIVVMHSNICSIINKFGKMFLWNNLNHEKRGLTTRKGWVTFWTRTFRSAMMCFAYQINNN